MLKDKKAIAERGRKKVGNIPGKRDVLTEEFSRFLRCHGRGGGPVGYGSQQWEGS
jgi:hypothetical protein